MLIPAKSLHLMADNRFYEAIGKLRINESNHLEAAKRFVPEYWTIDRRDIWFDCTPPNDRSPEQGWKIHLSATLGNAAAVLASVIPVLAEASVSFKFVADRTLLQFINSKRWDRGGAGKFVTTYPREMTQCARLLECLREATIGYSGPYILSDRRYRDSKIVRYRYGGFSHRHRLDADGRQVYVIETSAGEFLDDERVPYFKLPEDVVDPFHDPEQDGDEEGTNRLKGGRYEILEVLVFSNSGGVYRGRDHHEDRIVLIKEARPFTNVTVQGTDAVWSLKKEHRLLSQVADAEIAPVPYDFFQDWEHFYLVEEFLEDAQTLRSYAIDISLSLRTAPTQEDARNYYSQYCRIFTRIAECLEVVHKHRIVFSDLSFLNVLLLNGGEQIKFIDFEGAYQQGVDIAATLFTPGFAPRSAEEGKRASPEDDLFSLGSLMMAALMPINDIMTLNSNAHHKFLDAMIDDIALPEPIATCIRGLLEQDESLRPDISQVLELLSQEYKFEEPRIETRELEGIDLLELASRTTEFTLAVADFDREDRLFPADPNVFDTNPLSLGFGACGVAYAMQRIHGQTDSRVLDWIVGQPIRFEVFPPGLYRGLSGIAWALLELGQIDRACEILEGTHGHHLQWRTPDLFNGVAGWGMTQLRFFLATGDEAYLARAREAGRHLLKIRTQEGSQCWWSGSEFTACGLGHGAAGVSLFLLYLYLATGNEEYVEVGCAGLDFVAANSYPNSDGDLSWKTTEDGSTYTPYWRWGTAGIGKVVVRYHRVLGRPDHLDLLNKMIADTDRKYTIFPGLFFGLAGLGDFHMDLVQFGYHPGPSLARARKTLAGCLLFRLDEPEGLAFPGESLGRISCDYGTGSAGIGLLAYRIATMGPADFMLDELIPEAEARQTTSATSQLVAAE